MNWKTLLQSASVSVNDDLRLRVDYLTAENRIFRQQVSGRLRLSDRDRKELGELGRQLGRKAMAEIATVAQPDTIIAWGRKFANQQVATSKPPKSVGRPRVDQELEDLVIPCGCWWITVVTQSQQLCPIQFGEARLNPTVSELAPCDEGHPLFPDKGKVVILSQLYCRPIRDGPIRHQQRFNNLSKEKPVKVA